MNFYRNLINNLAIASLLAIGTTTSSQGNPFSLSSFFESAVGRTVLESSEVQKIARTVLGQPVHTANDLKAFLARLESSEFRPFESSLRQLIGRSQRESFETFESLTAPAPALAPQNYETVRTRFKNGTAEVRKFPSGLRDAEGEISPLAAFGPGDHVILTASEDGDFTLFVGDQRYSGAVIGYPTINSANVVPQKIKPGLAVRFSHLSPKTVAELKAAIQASAQSITVSCVNGACLKLKQGGIILGGAPADPAEPSLPIFRSDGLRRIIEDGFRDVNGTPLHYEILLNSRKSFEDLFESFVEKDVLMRRLTLVYQNKYKESLASILESGKDLDPETELTALALIRKGLPPVVVIGTPTAR
jgi:hypothetical protein